MTDDQSKPRTIESPLEGIFDIEPGTTLSTFQPERNQTAVPAIEVVDDTPITDPKDEEDVQIDRQLSTVYDYAMEAFESQHTMSQTIDPKFAARNAEVAAQFLKIALDSTSDRANIKHNRKKLRLVAGQPAAQINNGTVTNNIIADRNAILKMLKKDDD